MTGVQTCALPISLGRVRREAFVPEGEAAYAYLNQPLPIGHGQTISQPFMVAIMTELLDLSPTSVVLEVGTGSGYQGAYLAYLTDKVWTIEIIKPLAERTRGIYDALVERGYTEYGAISSRNADGYHGWEEEAPFDKIKIMQTDSDQLIGGAGTGGSKSIMNSGTAIVEASAKVIEGPSTVPVVPPAAMKSAASFTFLPLTNTATRPFFGPATNHIAKDFLFTLNNADAPVMDVVCTDLPCASDTAFVFHAEGTGTAGAGDA